MAHIIRDLSGRRIDHTHHIPTQIGISYLLSVSVIAVLILFMMFSIPRLVSAQEENYPVPISPENGKIDVPVTNVVFSWKHFFVGTMEYTFQLSKSTNMPEDDLVIEAKTQNGGTTYKYWGTLDYDTTYFWWVSATDPIGGVWSPVFSFRTISEPPESTPSDTDESSFGDFFKIEERLKQGKAKSPSLFGGVSIFISQLYFKEIRAFFIADSILFLARNKGYFIQNGKL